MLDAALRYARMGLRVLPLRARSKKPWLEDWPTLATTDEEVIEGWWRERPDSQVGIATGPGSDVWALDVDPRHGGDVQLAELEVEFGQLPETLTAETGTGGRHYLYLLPPGLALRNRQGIWPGIDARGEAGYIVAAPSVHPDTGRAYRFITRVPAVLAPTWLVEAVVAKKEAPVAGRPAPAPIPIEEGSVERRFVAEALRLIVDVDLPQAGGGDGGHKVLVAKAKKMGGYIAAGLIDEAIVRAQLVAAGVAAAQSPRGVERGVNFGLEEGKKVPIVPTVRAGSVSVSGSGGKASRDEVLAWWQANPEASSREVARVFGVDDSLVRRWARQGRDEDVRPHPPGTDVPTPRGQQSPPPGDDGPHPEGTAVPTPGDERPHPPGTSVPTPAERPSPPATHASPVQRLSTLLADLPVKFSGRADKLEAIAKLVGDEGFIDALARLRLTEPDAGNLEIIRLRSAVYGGSRMIIDLNNRLSRRNQELTEGGDQPEDPRVVIRVSGKAPGVIEQALDALSASQHVDVFQRAGGLVHVAADGYRPGAGEKHFAPDSPAIVPMAPARLRELLSVVARWVVSKSKGDDWIEVETLPPQWVVDAILARNSWNFRNLRGFLEIPILHEDGSFHTVPGFDRDSRYYHAPRWDFQATLPNQPTRAEARDAYATLVDPFCDFEFETPSDKAAVAAAVLTIVARPAIDGSVPLFPILSTTPGSGKGLIADLIASIATGRHLSRTAHVEDEEETEKRITALLLIGAPVVLIDNVDGALGGRAMDAALTAASWTGRILGQTRMVTIEQRTIWMATGNNFSISGDLARRVVPVQLVPKEARPDLRTNFRHGNETALRAHVVKHRADLLGAAFTILRAHALAGRPSSAQPLSSFEGWSSIVRDALMWAGAADPIEGQQRLREAADEKVNAIASMLHAWFEFFGPQEVFLSEVAGKLQVDGAVNLREAMKLVCYDRRGEFDPVKLGHVLRRNQRRIFNGLTIQRGGNARSGARAWKVTRMGDAPVNQVVYTEDGGEIPF